MHFLPHIFLALLASLTMWALSGMLIDATDRVARRYRRPGFAIAFIILGFLTSIGETSVAVNATIEGVPQVSAGNLVGASLVIFLLIIPVLAIVGHGVDTGMVRPRNIALILFVVLIPSLLAMDGRIGRVEGVMMLILYASMFYLVQKRRPVEETAEEVVEKVETLLTHHKHATRTDALKIVFAALLVFVSGKILVDEAMFFSEAIGVPPSFVGLLLLSVGTNIPELVIALRSVIGRHKDIAFGDYLGSAAANTFLFGSLAVVNDPFVLERAEFVPAFVLMFVGVVLFFIFCRTRAILSRKEGWILFGGYALFLVSQIAAIH